MINYTTRKKIFVINFEHAIKNESLLSIASDHFHVIEQREDNNFNYLDAITTTKCSVCPDCNHSSYLIKDKKVVYPLIANHTGKSVILRLVKKRFKCLVCNNTFTEPTPGISKYRQFGKEVITCVENEIVSNTYSDVARKYNIAVSSVIRIFDTMSMPQTVRYTKVKHLLIDELSLVAPSYKQNFISYNSKNKYIPDNVGKYQFAAMDADTGIVLDILPSRSKKAVEQYLIAKFDVGNLETISMDLWNPYVRAIEEYNLRTNRSVKIIGDKFHIVRQAMWDFDAKRIELQSTFETNTPEYKAIKGCARVLRMRTDRLTVNATIRVAAALETSNELYLAHAAKDEYLTIVKTSISGDDFVQKYNKWLINLSPATKIVFKRTRSSHKNFEELVKNAFNYKYSNGLIEGLNKIMKTKKRNANGYRNIERTAKLMKYDTMVRMARKNKQILVNI